MVLQFITLEEKFKLNRDVVHLGTEGSVHPGVVMEHLHQVLTYFAVKGYGKFYIGMTNDLDDRLREHQRKKPEFKLMCPIYTERSNIVENAFDRLEQEAIQRFRGGIRNPDTGRVMTCENGPGGASPKTWLYILVS
ncbi:hypothetical protein WJ63_00700 [Burkholderia pyrrocinia]|nr:hypothetical protein WJ63_00700 [Burkholderia pyrrocinia]